MGPLALPPWIGIALFCLGVVVLIGAGRTLLAGRRRARSWLRRDGRVVSSRLDDGAIRYQVSFRHEGREIRFWNRFTSGTGIDPVGREVTVLVNPADAGDAVVERGAAGSGVSGAAFGLFGLVLVAVGVVVLGH